MTHHPSVYSRNVKGGSGEQVNVFNDLVDYLTCFSLGKRSTYIGYLVGAKGLFVPPSSPFFAWPFQRPRPTLDPKHWGMYYEIQKGDDNKGDLLPLFRQATLVSFLIDLLVSLNCTDLPSW